MREDDGLRDMGEGSREGWSRHGKGDIGSGARVRDPSFILVPLVGLIKHLRHKHLSQD